MDKKRREKVRLSQQGLLVLKAFLEDLKKEKCGSDIMKITGLPSGTIYPILLRFENLGLVKSHWEKEEAKSLKRPRRRFYFISDRGAIIAREALFELHLSFSSLLPEGA